MTTARRSRALWWGAVFAVWTVLSLLSVAQGMLFFAYRGLHVAPGRLVVQQLADWYTCAVFTPAFFWLARRFPIDRRRWRASVPAHLAASAACVVGKYALFAPVLRRLQGAQAPPFGRLLASNFITELMIIWAAIGVVHAIGYYRRLRERETVALQLQARLAEARLDALTSQLQPHFLFNTLSGIATLMHRDVDAADQMLTRLADLLRATLRRETHEHPLAAELELLERYLGIMRIRFGPRLTVEVDVPPAARAALIPRFLLQPLVENALEHGVARRPGAGRVRVEGDTRRDAQQDVLRLAVSDDGPGVAPDDAADRNGVGLTNTRLRLEQLYGAAQRLTLEAPPGGGTRVVVELPLRTAPSREEA